MHAIFSFSRLLTGCGLVLAFTLIGCSGGSKLPGDTGSVKGKVTLGSGTIPVGSVVVMVHRDTGIVALGVTDSAGQFAMRMRDKHQVLVGDYTVNIRPPGDPDENIEVLTMENVPPEWKKVPQKYWDPVTSNEHFVVKPGNNTYDLVLHDLKT